MISKVWRKIDPFTPYRDRGNAPCSHLKPGYPRHRSRLLTGAFNFYASELSGLRGQNVWAIPLHPLQSNFLSCKK